ncbi:MAG: phosphatase PAP2 family protein [Kofleriaceae bacterium]
MKRSAIRWLRALNARTFALFGGAVIASVLFGIIASQLRKPAFDLLDKNVELAVHKLDSTPADLIAAAASFIGSNKVLIPVVLAVIGYAIYKKQRTIAVIVSVDAIAVIIGNLWLKNLFDRPRPQLFDKIPLPTDYSFPSGHSMSAVGVWGVIFCALIALFPKHRVLFWICGVTLIPLIGLSRIYFGVHWPFDVLGGFLAGTPALVVAVYLIHHRKQPGASVGDLVVKHAVESP